MSLPPSSSSAIFHYNGLPLNDRQSFSSLLQL